VRVRLFALSLALLLSGCLSTDGAGDGGADGSNVSNDDGAPTWGKPIADPWPAVQAKMAGVPCEAPVNSGQSENLVLLANVTYDLELTGIHGEVDIRNGLALHARYDQGGFELIDVRDPLHPVALGVHDPNAEDGGNSYDVKFSPDNATALYGAGNEIAMVDVRDPLNPVSVGNWSLDDATPTVPQTGHTHMLFTARIAGEDWVFIAPNANTGIFILRMTGTPDARSLEYVAQTLPVEGGPIGPHDLYVQQDEVDGHWYLYSADGFHGWTVFNIDDPTSPELAGGLVNPAEAAYTHSIQAQWVNGRRLVATIGEVGVNIFKVYDGTNLRAPLLLGVYQASPGPGSAAPEHNFNVVGGKLYLSYYTLGMYIFDLTKLSGIPVADTPNMQPVAHWGTNSETAPGATDFNGIWDTVLVDGVIYLSNIEGGLYIVGYGCNGPFPNAALTSTG
jgi:hypothetical protein